MSDFTWILGPCSMENWEVYSGMLSRLEPVMRGRDWIYKASYDKANRSSVHGGRGPGLDEALEMFKLVREMFPDVRLTTDVHEVWQVEKVAEAGVHIVQIPAFLCRQTDLLVESSKLFDVVNIKKGQWMSPQNMVQGVDKIKETNPDTEAWITERGTQFGYGQLIVDFGAVDLLKEHFDKVIFDCTHSTQRLKPNGRTGGDRELAQRFMQTAPIFGYDGVFAETHHTPDAAVSDADCQIPFDKMEELVEAVEMIGRVAS